MRYPLLAFAFALALALPFAIGSSSAFAQNSDRGDKQPGEPTLYTSFGMSFSLGGGVIGFTDSNMRDFASEVGGAWDVRAVAGTRERFAVEAAYSGGAYSIDALGLDASARLISTGLEANVRYNLLMDEWQPYVAAGAGWRRYDVTNADFNTSSVSDSDNLFEVPVGAGVAYRYGGFIADLRGTVRFAFDNDLVAESESATKPDLHSWQAQLTGGWEF